MSVADFQSQIRSHSTLKNISKITRFFPALRTQFVSILTILQKRILFCRRINSGCVPVFLLFFPQKKFEYPAFLGFSEIFGTFISFVMVTSAAFYCILNNYNKRAQNYRIVKLCRIDEDFRLFFFDDRYLISKLFSISCQALILCATSTSEKDQSFTPA